VGRQLFRLEGRKKEKKEGRKEGRKEETRVTLLFSLLPLEVLKETYPEWNILVCFLHTLLKKVPSSFQSPSSDDQSRERELNAQEEKRHHTARELQQLSHQCHDRRKEKIS
jgi:hypothetical protein